MDLGHVGIFVRDFDGMLAFHQRVFGFSRQSLKDQRVGLAGKSWQCSR